MTTKMLENVALKNFLTQALELTNSDIFAFALCGHSWSSPVTGSRMGYIRSLIRQDFSCEWASASEQYTSELFSYLKTSKALLICDHDCGLSLREAKSNPKALNLRGRSIVQKMREKELSFVKVLISEDRFHFELWQSQPSCVNHVHTLSSEDFIFSCSHLFYS